MSEVQNEVATQTEAAQAGATPTFGAGLVSLVKKFNFKARTLKDENGKEIEKLPKQPSLEVNVPVPTAAYLIDILNQPDTLTDTDAAGAIVSKPNLLKQLVVESTFEPIFWQVKQQLDQAIEGFGTDKTKQISVSHLDYDKLTLEYISSIPPARRGAAAISEEDWNDWFKDYLNVMLQATGKPLDKLTTHVDIFKKLPKYRARKDLLEVLQQQLAIYAQSATNLDEYVTPYQRVTDTITRFLTEEDRIDISAL